MIYLCSVYSAPTVEEMQLRYDYVLKKTGEYLNDYKPVFSPIVHCHEIARIHGLPRTWEFWQFIDLEYMKGCTEVWVLMMPGWKESVGITAELKHAEEVLGLKITYIECDDYADFVKAASMARRCF